MAEGTFGSPQTWGNTRCLGIFHRPGRPSGSLRPIVSCHTPTPTNTTIAAVYYPKKSQGIARFPNFLETWPRPLCAAFYLATRRRFTRLLSWCFMGSFCFVAWIAYVEYHMVSRSTDVRARICFVARWARHGLHPRRRHHRQVDRFPGPFMVQFDGQWFAHMPGRFLT